MFWNRIPDHRNPSSSSLHRFSAKAYENPPSLNKLFCSRIEIYQTKLYFVYKEGLYSVPRNSLKAEQWLRKAADHDDAEAQYELGSNVLLGREGFKRDFKEGRKWLRKAVIHESVEAYLIFRILYEQEPTPMNNFFRKGNVNKYRTEAENGNTDSMELIGDCYLL